MAKRIELHRLPEAQYLSKLIVFEALLQLSIAQLTAFTFLDTDRALAFFHGLYVTHEIDLSHPLAQRYFYLHLCIVGLVCGLPYLAFKIPVIGPSLLGVKPTGYDQAGNVRPLMTRAEIQAKWAKEEKQAAKEEKHAHAVERERIEILSPGKRSHYYRKLFSLPRGVRSAAVL